MCTLVILRRPEHPWPLILAGNRDERRDRPAEPPARHWPDRPEVVAGLDRAAGGSWFGVNDHGVVAAVMNRERTLGPAPGKRSRGELVLEALDHAEADEAVAALEDLDPAAYRPFNLFVGDPVSAHWLRHAGPDRPVEALPVPAGLHLLTAADLNDTANARIRAYLPGFRQAAPPDPESDDWEAWRMLVADRRYPQDAGPHAAMNLDLPDGFGTVCSQLLALPRYPTAGMPPVFRFAAGPPDRVGFDAVRL